MNKYVTLILLILPGILLSLFSLIVFFVLFPGIIHSQVEQQIRLVEYSDTWNKWREAPIPIYLTFYVFHVTNPDEMETGIQAKFEEKGPYVYRQKRVKVDIKQENGENSVKYREVKTYYFDREKSGSNTEDDLINILNIPFVGIIHAILKMLPLDLIAGIIGNIILQGEPLIKRDIKIRELLFEGFDVTKYTSSLLARQLPKEFSGGRFGLYKGKNGTASEEWEVFTGVESNLDFGRLKSWNEKPDLGFWQKFSGCDKLSGTDGTIFHSFLTKETILYAFSNDICRSIFLRYSENVEHLGIPGYRFTAPRDNFEDPRISEATRCYCLEDELEKCHYAGVLPLESCTQAPIWISLPHFLDSDIRYMADAGLDPPDREIHQTFLDFEPLTGLVLRAHKRLQINLEVKFNRRVRALEHFPKEKMLFPIIWADESAEIDEKLANDLKSMLFTPLEIVDVAKWVLLALGIVFVIAGVYVSIQRYNLLGKKDLKDGPKKPNQRKVSLPTSLSSSRSKRGSAKVEAEDIPGRRENVSSASNISVSYIESS